MTVADSIILGSRSPQRRELLTSMVGAQSLKIMPPLTSAEADFHGILDDPGFEIRLLEIVRDKFEDVRHQLIATNGHAAGDRMPLPYIVVADTIVIATNDEGHKRVLGQPDPEHWQSEVRDWLHHWLAGRTHEVWTGVIVSKGDDAHHFIVKSSVTFCTMSPEMIQ